MDFIAEDVKSIGARRKEILEEELGLKDAEGVALDVIGGRYGLDRSSAEADYSFRIRIRARL